MSRKKLKGITQADRQRRGSPEGKVVCPPAVVHNAPNTPIVLGNPLDKFWLFSERDGLDLTHPDTPGSTPVSPRLRLETVNTPITIDPKKSAIVVVDMQNLFLSQPRNSHHAGHNVEKVLVERAIPLARKAKIQVIWLNWGLSDADLKKLPPNLERVWGFQMDGTPNLAQGIGSDIGPVKTEDGKETQGGRLLMKDCWNTKLHPPLERLRQRSLKHSPPDELVYKNRICGMSYDDSSSPLEQFLKARGITTLLFGGINVEFCVMSTMAAANLKGYDTVLLADCTGTTNGEAPMLASLQMCRKGWGFCSSSTALESGIKQMLG